MSRTNSTGVNAFDKLIDLTKLERHSDIVANAANLTYSASEPQSIIDWILFRNSPGSRIRLKPVSNQVMHNQLSDHFAVMAEFEIVE
jgi:endonuclease/exonuclease/phosphatase family metal-dependent hydrolase